MKLAGSELEPSLFSSEAGKLSLYRDAGTGDLEGRGDLDKVRDCDLTTWPRGDPWPEEFSASKEWCATLPVLVADSWNVNDYLMKWFLLSLKEWYEFLLVMFWKQMQPVTTTFKTKFGQVLGQYIWTYRKILVLSPPTNKPTWLWVHPPLDISLLQLFYGHYLDKATLNWIIKNNASLSKYCLFAK